MIPLGAILPFGLRPGPRQPGPFSIFYHPEWAQATLGGSVDVGVAIHTELINHHPSRVDRYTIYININIYIYDARLQARHSSAGVAVQAVLGSYFLPQKWGRMLAIQVSVTLGRGPTRRRFFPQCRD